MLILGSLGNHSWSVFSCAGVSQAAAMRRSGSVALRQEPAQIGQNRLGPPDEHARVPGVLAALDILLRRLLVGLLLERLHRVDRVLALGALARIGAFDISELGAGKCGLDAERDQGVGVAGDELEGIGQRLLKHLRRLQKLIGGQQSP